MTLMKPHPYSLLFPTMTPEVRRGLKESIQAHGVREPIWIYQGQILDGRHRYAVAQELGVECPTKEFVGSDQDALRMVMDANFNRRDLTASQRASIHIDCAEIMATLETAAKERMQAGKSKGGKESGKTRRGEQSNTEELIPQCSTRAPQSRDDAAKIAGTNPRYIQDAKKIKSEAPDVHEQVKSGAMTIPQAKEEMEYRRVHGRPPEDLIQEIQAEWGKIHARHLPDPRSGLKGGAGNAINVEKAQLLLRYEGRVASHRELAGIVGGPNSLGSVNSLLRYGRFVADTPEGIEPMTKAAFDAYWQRVADPRLMKGEGRGDDAYEASCFADIRKFVANGQAPARIKKRKVKPPAAEDVRNLVDVAKAAQYIYRPDGPLRVALERLKGFRGQDRCTFTPELWADVGLVVDREVNALITLLTEVGRERKKQRTPTAVNAGT